VTKINRGAKKITKTDIEQERTSETIDTYHKGIRIDGYVSEENNAKLRYARAHFARVNE